MGNVYLAAPFFNKKQLLEVKEIEKLLKVNPTVSSVFSPRLGKVTAAYGTPVWSKQIFKLDTSSLIKSDVILAVIDFDNNHVDSGTAFEIGYANALKKPVVLFNNDRDHVINLMLTSGAVAYLTRYQSIKKYNFNDLKKVDYLGNRL